jgi:hypothetical protein
MRRLALHIADPSHFRTSRPMPAPVEAQLRRSPRPLRSEPLAWAQGSLDHKEERR